VERPICERRIARIFDQAVGDYGLDLTGLVVLTEAATGPYLYTPLLAARAGATVRALAADSRYGLAADVAADTRAAAGRMGLEVEVVAARTLELFASADIVTNTGPLRPLDALAVGAMAPHAVIPLMWETWEHRPDEVDLRACAARGVVCLGTRESPPPLAYDGYLAATAARMLFELGLELYKTRVLLVGAGLGDPIARGLPPMGCEVCWAADAPGADLPLAGLPDHWAAEGARYDAILLAEHRDFREILGPAGVLTPSTLADAQPALAVGVIAGGADASALRAAGLRVFPERLRPARYMSYQPVALGPRPVLELYAAGLAVGQAMSRARKAGCSVPETIQRALRDSPAMAFS